MPAATGEGMDLTCLQFAKSEARLQAPMCESKKACIRSADGANIVDSGFGDLSSSPKHQAMSLNLIERPLLNDHGSHQSTVRR